MTDLALHAGRQEEAKAGFHLAAFGLFAVLASYNAMAFHARKERHLLVNAGLYLAAVAFESYQLHRHWEGR